MSILLIVILVLAVIGLALCLFKVPVDQRTVNTFMFAVIVLLCIYLKWGHL